MDLKERLRRHLDYKKRHLALCSRWRIKYGQYMRKEREDAGLSLREMAKAVGKSSSLIFSMEEGSTYWTMPLVTKYLEVARTARTGKSSAENPAASEVQNGVPAQS
jgi:ribosome-binding protein aMBF1 (putative translation factor)